MVASPLVDPYIEDGRKLVERLDGEGLSPEAALWFYLSESHEWRLILALKQVDELGPRETYKRIQRVLDAEPSLSLRNVSVVSPDDDTIQLLRRAIRTSGGISSIRFTGNAIDGIFIEDALIYRL